MSAYSVYTGRTLRLVAVTGSCWMLYPAVAELGECLLSFLQTPVLLGFAMFVAPTSVSHIRYRPSPWGRGRQPPPNKNTQCTQGTHHFLCSSYSFLWCQPNHNCAQKQTNQTVGRIRIFIGPANCNHYNCNHILSSKPSESQIIIVQVLKQSVVTVAVVTVCWSHECWSSRNILA